jgi:CBS domain-containing protein
MGLIAELLQKRSPVVHPMGPHQTVADAVAVMAENGIGAVPIVRDGHLIGIFSERDLLRRVVAKGRALEEVALEEVMTPDPITAVPGDSRDSAVRKMAEVGCRHLPVMAGDAIVDMLSMRDLLFVQIAEQGAEIDALKQYIRGG